MKLNELIYIGAVLLVALVIYSRFFGQIETTVYVNQTLTSQIEELENELADLREFKIDIQSNLQYRELMYLRGRVSKLEAIILFLSFVSIIIMGAIGIAVYYYHKNLKDKDRTIQNLEYKIDNLSRRRRR